MSTDISQERLTKIQALRTEADRLMNAAQHDRLKAAEILMAVRDLDEASYYLSQPGIESRPTMVRVVDYAIELAVGHLQEAAKLIAAGSRDVTPGG